MIKNILFTLFVCFMLVGCKTNKPSSNYYPLAPIDSIPNMPILVVDNNVPILDSDKVEEMIRQYVGVEWYAEDQKYFIPTRENMEVIVSYLDQVFKKFGIHYIAEGTDCDDFARLKTSLSKLILSQTYDLKASPAIFTIFVRQKFMWASVPAGGSHALIAYACIDENREMKIFVWEPQSSDIISAESYPNKKYLFYVGNERFEKSDLKDESSSPLLP